MMKEGWSSLWLVNIGFAVAAEPIFDQICGHFCNWLAVPRVAVLSTQTGAHSWRGPSFPNSTNINKAFACGSEMRTSGSEQIQAFEMRFWCQKDEGDYQRTMAAVSTAQYVALGRLLPRLAKGVVRLHDFEHWVWVLVVFDAKNSNKREIIVRTANRTQSQSVPLAINSGWYWCLYPRL